MGFYDPGYQLWFLALLLLLGTIIYARVGWRRTLTRIGDPELIASLTNRRSGLRKARLLLLFLAVFLMVLALMRPRWGIKSTVERELGIDLAVVIDISNSMNAGDIPPTRLKRVLAEVETLTDLLAGHRIAVVLFAGAAFIQCPLTADNNAVKLFLESVSSDMINLQGTDLETALTKAARVLRSRFKRNRAVLLFSDGESHEGDAVAIAERMFKNDGIRVFTVGVGTKRGSLVPADQSFEFSSDSANYKKDSAGNFIKSTLDEKLLSTIAARSGGDYFRIHQGAFDVAAVAKRINTIERSTLGERKHEAMIDRYPFFLAAALCCLLGFLVLPDRSAAHV